MTLAQLLATLDDNASLMVTLVDSSANNLIKFNAAGYEAVDSATLARTVNKITVNGQYAISVLIADAE